MASVAISGVLETFLVGLIGKGEVHHGSVLEEKLGVVVIAPATVQATKGNGVGHAVRHDRGTTRFWLKYV